MIDIEIKKWKEILPGGKESEANTLKAITFLLSSKKPEEIPKGLDKFRLFNRIGRAFDEAEKSGKLELEEGDYAFLKDIVVNDIPSSWGMNKNIAEAIDLFVNAKNK